MISYLCKEQKKECNQVINHITPMAQSKGINFKGQNIYVGIDVHLKSWHVTVLTESGFKRKHSQPSSALALYEHLNRHYPGGIYHAVYESGFSGFSTYYSLMSYGIRCVIAHAADVPVGQYESVMKNDAVDSDRLARALRDGSLRQTVYVPSKEILDHRGILRFRTQLQKQLCGYKSRVKHLLHNNGVCFPDCFSRSSTHWSSRFMLWLRKDVRLLSPTRETLDLLMTQIDRLRTDLLSVTRRIRELSRSEAYAARMELLLSIPGIGVLTAMHLLCEVENPERFNGQRAFASYLGLVPTSHDSGEKKRTGEMTFRGNKRLRTLLVESSWVAIGRDRALAACYGELRRRMEPQEAIVRIARKLSNRILSVLKTGKRYEYERCC